MSYATLILGESGTGKTCSLRHLDPKKTLLIEPCDKPLPFKAAGWAKRNAKTHTGNIVVCEEPAKIVAVMKKADFDIIVIDDWQYILMNQFMLRRSERSYEKFTDIAGAGFDIVKTAGELDQDRRVYILSHTTTDESGKTRIKTLGKLLDDKVVVEGMFTTVLRTKIDGDRYLFTTQNSGSDTVKSPMGLFDTFEIENDLAAVDKMICAYYGIGSAGEKTS